MGSFARERRQAEAILRDAADLFRERWHRAIDDDGLREKSSADYVTASDLVLEDFLRERLAHAAPSIPVLGEEGGGERAGTFWAVDPIDGTTNFSRRYPLTGISIGLVADGIPVVGAVAAPMLSRYWIAERGGGCSDETGAAVRPVSRQSDFLVAAALPFRRRDRLPRYRSALDAVFDRVDDIRRGGAACLDLAYTAQGALDGYFELGLSVWDVAAGIVLVRETGGVVTDWSGDPDAVLDSGDIIAGSPACHRVLLEAVAGAGPLDTGGAVR